MTCSSELSSATSVSGVELQVIRWHDAQDRCGVGSATISFAPRLTAFFIHVAATG
jgi:hypothetical protein